VAFIVHTGWGIHMAFKRWGWWNRFSMILLIVIYVALASFFIYVDRLGGSSAPQKAGMAGQGTMTTVSNTVTDNSSQKIFSVKELSSFDGKGGRPAYVAVNGVVYDLSSVFKDGSHAGYEAGMDQSEAFHAQHYSEILKQFKMVGALSAQ